MAIFRVEKTKNYTVMSNYHLRDRSLSNAARGLLSQMLSLPDSWDYTMKGLVSMTKEGDKAVRSEIAELEQAGYVARTRVNGEHGRYDYIYDVYEAPYSPSGHTVEGHTLEGHTLKDTLLNTNILSTKELSTKGLNTTKARLKSERGKNSSKTVMGSSVVASETLTHLKEKQAKGSTKALAKSPSTMEIKNQSSPAVVKPTTKKNKVDGKLKAMWFAEMLDTWEKAMGVKLKLAGQSRTYNCEAVTRLVLYYNQDIEQLKRTIMALPELSKEQGEYALEISDFVDLEQKLNKIMAWGRKRQLNQMKKAQEEEALKNYHPFDF